MDEVESLIFRTDRIGDFIISFPFIQSFKDNFPKSSISLVSSEYNSQFIKKFQFISNTIPFMIATLFPSLSVVSTLRI